MEMERDKSAKDVVVYDLPKVSIPLTLIIAARVQKAINEMGGGDVFEIDREVLRD